MTTYSNDIPGWMSEGELNWLYERASEMRSVVEIGSWRGRSTHALLSGCLGTVYAVDTFEGCGLNPDGFEGKDEDIFRDFWLNVGHFPKLMSFKSSSINASRNLPTVDFVFIDGNHDYSQVMDDILAWWPKARRLIAGHDYGNTKYPGVQAAVKMQFGEKFELFESIWFVRKAIT